MALDTFQSGHVKADEIQSLLATLKGLSMEMMGTCREQNWPEDLLYPAVAIAELCQVAEHQISPHRSPTRANEASLPPDTLAPPHSKPAVPPLALNNQHLPHDASTGMTALFRKVGERLHQLLDRAGPEPGSPPMHQSALASAATAQTTPPPASSQSTPFFSGKSRELESSNTATDSPRLSHSLLPQGVSTY